MRQRMLNKQYRLIQAELKERNEADALQLIVDELKVIVRRHLREADRMEEERDKIERILCPITELPPKEEKKKRTVSVKLLDEEQLRKVAERLGLNWDELKEAI